MKLTPENVGVLVAYLDIFDRPGYKFVVLHSRPSSASSNSTSRGERRR